PRLVEGDGELVVLDALDRAVSELLVEDAVAGLEAANASHLLAPDRHRAAFDERHTRSRRPARLAQDFGLAPAAKVASLREARHQPRLGQHLDVRRRQLVDEARGDRALPLPVDAAIGGEADGGAFPCAGKPDIRESALLLQRFEATLLKRALIGEDAFLPA